MREGDIFVGFLFLLIGQVIQIMYHQYHDRRQNEYLRQIAENTSNQYPKG